VTVFDVIRRLRDEPFECLVRRWNWKSAVFSSIIRATIFFCMNLKAGKHAAAAAMLTELSYRLVTSGFYGALTQAFSDAEPPWAAALTVMFLLPLCQHSIELTVHLLRGTPRLLPSMIASVIFTGISTLFNLYAMRRGVLVVGDGARPVGTDLRAIPATVAGFLAAGPLALFRWIAPPGINQEAS